MAALSIIIVNYKSWIVLEKCLESIISQNNSDVEVIISDNNSGDKELNKFKKKYTKFTWISNTKNLGFSRACNQGAKIAKNGHYLFLNPDTELEKDCLIKLKTKISAFPNSIISIMQIGSNGINKYPYGEFLSLKSFNGILRFLSRSVKCNYRYNDYKKPFLKPDWVSGSFLLIDKKNFNNLSGWDEDYWMYYEDMDLCRRAKNIGMDVVLLNNIFCTHHHGKSSRIDLKTTVKTKTQLIKSGLIFIIKHYSGLYQKILKFMFIGSNLVELLLLCPFSRKRRLILRNLIFNLRVENF